MRSSDFKCLLVKMELERCHICFTDYLKQPYWFETDVAKTIICSMKIIFLPDSNEFVQFFDGENLVDDLSVICEQGEQGLGQMLVRLLVFFALKQVHELVSHPHRRERVLELGILLAHGGNEKTGLEPIYNHLIQSVKHNRNGVITWHRTKLHGKGLGVHEI